MQVPERREKGMPRKRILISLITFISVFILLILAFAASAENTPKKNDNKAIKIDRVCGFEKLAQRLNLTEAQKTALKSIQEDRRSKIKAILSDKNLSKEQKRGKIRQVLEESRARIKSLLTPEQEQRLNANLLLLDARSKQLMRRAFNPIKSDALKKKALLFRNKARRATTRLADALKLTENQKEQIRAIMQKNREQIKAIMQDQNLSAEQKKAKIRSIREDSKAEIKKILTPEQQEKVARLKQNAKKPSPKA
ncbi:MAG: hypothetical protein K6T99_06920 [Armatimonadetes bacterium]|nr:hypothetical protein [Armatimonadota bacterium]